MKQVGKAVKLELSKSSRTFTSASAASKPLAVTANVPWTAKSSVSWIKLAKAGGNGNGTIVFNVAKNEGAKREAVITVKGDGKTVKCRIVQDAVQRANRKFALCVGVKDTYFVNNANYFANNLAKRGGGWSSIKKYTGNAATKKAVRSYIANIAAQTIPGDTFVYCHSSHGSWNGGTSVSLYMSDGLFYKDTELAADLGKFPAGVKVVLIVNACHSGGLFKGRKAVSDFPLAERVSSIMEENRQLPAARGKRGFVNKISPSEIGWVTSADYYQSSYSGSFFYDTGDWLTSKKATGKVKGSLFMAAFTWGWWYGEADAKGDGDGDRQFDAYEGYSFAKPYCEKHSPAFNPQCRNEHVLRSVELGSCGRANLKFCKPSGWPAAVFVTTSKTSTGQQTQFTALGSTIPCVRYAWYNASQNKVTDTGTAAWPHTVRYEVDWPLDGPHIFNHETNSFMPGAMAKRYCRSGTSRFTGGAIYAAPREVGTFTVKITLDSTKQVSESDESDNTATVRFTVVSGRGTKKGGPEILQKGNGTVDPEGVEAGTPTGQETATRAADSPGDDDWVAVTTSDGENGGVLLDGDEGTGWGPVGEGGGWVVLSYSEAIDVKGVSVKGEGLPEDGVRVLLSEDADDWREGTEGRAQYVWVIVPEGSEGAMLTEIEVEEE